ncbi:MAG TPA: KEOPS complex subunit Pcc1 [Thermoplasmata archaeon]|jgi:KEOPS complex subunit Pcc1|nr:KEOPS complex subunit Pcc1 [Thermoplasmata archaeon]
MTARRATITLDGAEADIVRRALAPEAGRDVPKARVVVSGSKGRATIAIHAEDTSALRAAVNSYLRWADVAARVVREVGR